MSMAISRMQELQACFPQLSRGTVESVLDQVGSERAVDVLLEMTSETGDCASHQVDIHPSQLMGALLPTEESRPFTASLSTVALDDVGKRDSSYLNFKKAPQAPTPVPLQRLTPSQPPLPPRYPQSPKQRQPVCGQHAWWPAWQGGRPVAQPSPPQLPPADASADDTPLEELLQTLNSGSDDSSSDCEACGPYGLKGRKQEVAKQASPKLRPYSPAAIGSAAASPRRSSILGVSSADASPDAEESDDVSMEQLLLDMIGVESAPVQDRGKGQSQVLDTNTAELDEHQKANGHCNGSSVLGRGPASAPVCGRSSGAADATALQAAASADSVLGAVIPAVGPAVSHDGLLAGCSAADTVVTGTSNWSPGEPWPEASDSPPGKRRPPSAADSLYSLSGSSGGKRSGGSLRAAVRGRPRSREGAPHNRASREPSVAKSEASSLSSGGAWDNSEDALSFLTTCFPGDPLVVDILAGCGGDANAATAKLLELRDEEQAHDLAAAMQEAQELSAAPAKTDMDEGQKLARLALEFMELSAAECAAALQSQAGNLPAAVAILDMHVSAVNAKTNLADLEVAKRVAAEERAAHERAVAEQQAADFAMAMGLQDVAKKEAEPSPAASPEDLAAIAALEAGDDLVLQPPRARPQPASPYLLTGRPPPPPPPLSLPATYTPHSRGHSTSDQLWKELRGPAEAVWEQRRDTMDAAATAYRKGRKAQGEELLRRAAVLKRLAEQKESEASHAMFRAKNLDLNTPVERIDLHGQKVQEAYDMLVDLLGPHIKYRHKPMVEIITGRGLHSEDGEARIRPVVKQYLQDNGLQFVERPGSFQVKFQA